MATSTLRPDATPALAVPWSIGGGAASGHVATNDNSDTTYVAHDTSTSPAALKLGFGTVTIPALAQVRSVQFRYRANLPSYVAGDNIQYRVDMYASGVQIAADTLAAGVLTAAIQTLAGAARTTDPGGGPWDQADINSLEAWVQFVSGTVGSKAFRLHELYADVVYNEAPATVVTAPAEGGTATTSRPTISWTYTDPEGDAQERYQAKVFSAAQYGEAGFDPETSQATWSSGEQFSANPSATVGVDLVNATTYRAYVKTADQGSGGRYGAWDYNQFTTSLSPAATPTLTATGIPADGRVELVITATDTVGTHAILEYSDDAGASWLRHRAGDMVELSTPAPGSITISDYELRDGLSRQYRAKVTDAAASRTSAPSTVQTIALDLTSWWLKDPLYPGLNQTVWVEGEDWFAQERPQDVGVFAPLGRDRKVVVAGQVRGAEMAFVIYAESQAKRDGLNALREANRTLLLQSANLEQWYIRLTRWVERRSGAGLTKWRFDVAAVEVDPPAGPEQGVATFILDVSVLG